MVENIDKKMVMNKITEKGTSGNVQMLQDSEQAFLLVDICFQTIRWMTGLKI